VDYRTRYSRDPAFSRFSTVPRGMMDGQMDRRTDWQTNTWRQHRPIPR